MSALQKLLAVFSVLLFAGIFQAASASAADETQLRIGDVMSLSLPGEESLTGDFAIDRNGEIALPEVGPIRIVGMSIAKAETATRQALAKAFRNVERFSLRLKEQKLLVAVAGQVTKPGTLELPGDATVEVAIATAGGLQAGAQLDRLKIIRDSKEITFNYKAYLDSGDPSLLPQLQPLDVIFVPISPLTGNVQIDFDAATLSRAGDGAEDGKAVRVFGEVANPAQFAYKEGMSIVDLIMRAGGVTRYAAVEQIRLISSGEPVLFNLQAWLDTGDPSLLPKMVPGSTVFVPILSDQIKRGKHTVYVMGEVAKPGAYDAQPGTTFIDILANAGGPTRYADGRQMRILKQGGKVMMFDMVAYTEGGNVKPPKIDAGDAILVPEKTDNLQPSWLKTPPDRAIHMLGAVYKPGRYEWSDEMSLFDLIANAGGPTESGDLSSIRILVNKDSRAKPVIFDMKAFIENGGDLSTVPQLHAGYTVMVPELPKDPTDNKSQWLAQSPDRSIYIMGAVGAPGRYAFNTTMGFLDILGAADGPTSKADLKRIRVSLRGKANADPIVVDLVRYMETGDESLLPRLEPGDMIYVPDREREWTDIATADTVRVIGAVAKPGRYSFNARMTILDLLAEAGGPNSDALQRRIVVVNMGKEVKAFHFDLEKFVRSGDYSLLPVVRPGDTVYVPDKTQSNHARFMEGIKDAAQVVGLLAAIAAL